MTPLAPALLAAACALSPVAPDTGSASAAIDTAATARWQVALTGGFEAFTSQRTAWQAYDARLERRDRLGTLAVEALAARRFSLWDAGAAVDAYHVLWRKAYGNVRIVGAPGARVIPRLDASVEVYQGVGPGWEVSAGYRRMSFLGSGVDLWSASAARYAGNWYVRVRGVVVPSQGTVGGSLGLLVRRYLRGSDDLLDLSGAAGKEVVTVGVGPVVEVRTSTEAALRFQKFLSPVWGVSATGTYAAEQGIPTRTGLTLGIIRRL